MGKQRLRGFARRMTGNAAMGPRCMGPAWHSGPVGGFPAAFRALLLLFGPFLRLWSISRGPMVAFSASQGGKRCSEAP